MHLDKSESYPLTARELSGAHLGDKVSLEGPSGSVTAILSGVEHRSDIVSNASFAEPHALALGRPKTLLTFLGWGTTEVPPEMPVTVHTL